MSNNIEFDFNSALMIYKALEYSKDNIESAKDSMEKFINALDSYGFNDRVIPPSDAYSHDGIYKIMKLIFEDVEVLKSDIDKSYEIAENLKNYEFDDVKYKKIISNYISQLNSNDKKLSNAKENVDKRKKEIIEWFESNDIHSSFVSQKFVIDGKTYYISNAVANAKELKDAENFQNEYEILCLQSKYDVYGPKNSNTQNVDEVVAYKTIGDYYAGKNSNMYVENEINLAGVVGASGLFVMSNSDWDDQAFHGDVSGNYDEYVKEKISDGLINEVSADNVTNHFEVPAIGDVPEKPSDNSGLGEEKYHDDQQSQPEIPSNDSDLDNTLDKHEVSAMDDIPGKPDDDSSHHKGQHDKHGTFGKDEDLDNTSDKHEVSAMDDIPGKPDDDSSHHKGQHDKHGTFGKDEDLDNTSDKHEVSAMDDIPKKPSDDLLTVKDPKSIAGTLNNGSNENKPNVKFILKNESVVPQVESSSVNFVKNNSPINSGSPNIDFKISNETKTFNLKSKFDFVSETPDVSLESSNNTILNFKSSEPVVTLNSPLQSDNYSTKFTSSNGSSGTSSILSTGLNSDESSSFGGTVSLTSNPSLAGNNSGGIINSTQSQKLDNESSTFDYKYKEIIEKLNELSVDNPEKL